MSPFKIRDKKPKDIIKKKTPKKEKDFKIKHKKPSNEDESFDLPPRKQNKEDIIPKKEILPPSNQGIRNQRESYSSKSNIPPPMSERSRRQRSRDNLQPSSKGYIPKKVKDGATNKTITPKVPKKVKIEKAPSSRGSKKIKDLVNKAPSSIKNKKFKKETLATLRGSPKTRRKKISSKKPPRKIEKKTPSKKKIILPPTFEERIPKTRIKKKKPH